jgi:hypothetical protein
MSVSASRKKQKSKTYSVYIAYPRVKDQSKLNGLLRSNGRGGDASFLDGHETRR